MRSASKAGSVFSSSTAFRPPASIWPAFCPPAPGSAPASCAPTEVCKPSADFTTFECVGSCADVDCPVRGAILATALAAATRCIAPVQAEDLVLQSLKALVDSVEQARQINPRLRGLSLLRNRYALRGAIDHAYDDALRDEYGGQLLQTIIPVRAALRHAAGTQQSVFRYASPDAGEVRGLFVDLVDELLRLDEVA